MKLKQTITEAEEVEFGSLDSKQQNKIKAVHKHVPGKRGYIFDGIHGLIVQFITSGDVGQISGKQIKGLAKENIRWMKPGKKDIVVGI